MGRALPKRLVRKLDLERMLSEVIPQPSPKASLEQYTIPTDVAAELLFLATYVYDDVVKKTVVDLGCGTGRLAIGAVLLGASEAIGIDIDRATVRVAKQNAEKLGIKGKTSWIAGDIEALRGRFHTILQNPPFGVQKRGADRRFLVKSLQLARKVYSLHKTGKGSRKVETKLVESSPSHFLTKLVERHGGRIQGVYAMMMTIPYMFKFHRRRVHKFVVHLYVIEKNLMSD